MAKLTRREREHLRREEEILKAAEKIFARDGYENASMNEIAKEAEFSKRTLYQYFENKSDLYLTIALRLYRQMVEQSHDIDVKQYTGYEIIKQGFISFFEFYKEHKSVYRIIYDMEKVKQETDNPKIKEFLGILNTLSQNLHDLIMLGQNDGSISKDLDPKKTTVALIFLLTGFFNQLSVTEHSPLKEVDIKEDSFALYVLELLRSALKGQVEGID